MNPHPQDRDIRKIKHMNANEHNLHVGRTVKGKLDKLTGEYWKEVVVEVQPRYNEIVVWILLYEDISFKDAHAKFYELIMPDIEQYKPLEIALFYHVVRDGKAIRPYGLVGNEAVNIAAHDTSFGEKVMYEDSLEGMFDNTDSKR